MRPRSRSRFPSGRAPAASRPRPPGVKCASKPGSLRPTKPTNGATPTTSTAHRPQPRRSSVELDVQTAKASLCSASSAPGSTASSPGRRSERRTARDHRRATAVAAAAPSPARPWRPRLAPSRRSDPAERLSARSRSASIAGSSSSRISVCESSAVSSSTRRGGELGGETTTSRLHRCAHAADARSCRSEIPLLSR